MRWINFWVKAAIRWVVDSIAHAIITIFTASSLGVLAGLSAKFLALSPANVLILLVGAVSIIGGLVGFVLFLRKWRKEDAEASQRELARINELIEQKQLREKEEKERRAEEEVAVAAALMQAGKAEARAQRAEEAIREKEARKLAREMAFEAHVQSFLDDVGDNLCERLSLESPVRDLVDKFSEENTGIIVKFEKNLQTPYTIFTSQSEVGSTTTFSFNSLDNLSAEGLVIAIEKLVAYRLPLHPDVEESGIEMRKDAVRLALSSQAIPHGSARIYSSIRVNKDQIIKAAYKRHGRRVCRWAAELLRLGSLNEAYHPIWSIRQIWVDEVIMFTKGNLDEIPQPLLPAA